MFPIASPPQRKKKMSRSSIHNYGEPSRDRNDRDEICRDLNTAFTRLNLPFVARTTNDISALTFPMGSVEPVREEGGWQLYIHLGRKINVFEKPRPRAEIMRAISMMHVFALYGESSRKAKAAR